MTDATDTHAYERLYSETIPSVVSVYVTPEGDERRDRGDRSDPGHHGAGSGFVYARTPVVTNRHVVGDATEVDLRFSERDWRRGRVVGTDAYTDLAVVAVEDLPAYATPLELVEAVPSPGTPVAALGNPMGLDGSISSGIVSGASRSMPTGNGFAIPDTVQTDAPINPGNSGGPLVTGEALRVPSGSGNGGESESDARAKVVGVNRARAGDNIGFAVSAEVVRRVVPELIETGEVRHSYLRIRTLDVSPTVAEANGLEAARGVLVVEVSLGPASGALVGCDRTRVLSGREVPTGGDVIVAIGGEPVDSHESLMRYLLLETGPGEEVAIDLLRDGERLTERVTLAERPATGRRRRRGRGGGHIPVR